VTGKLIQIPAVNEATALGGAFAAGVAVGEYGSIEEAAKSLVTWDKTYEPNMANTALYADVAARWKEAYAAQLGLVDRGVTTSMWKAPGL